MAEKDDELLQKFTPRAKEAVTQARMLAISHGQNFVGTEHLLLALIRQKQCIAVAALEHLGVDFEALTAELSDAMRPTPDAKAPLEPSRLLFSARARRVLGMARQEAVAAGFPFVGAEHLVLAILRDGGGCAAEALKHHKVTYEEVQKWIVSSLDPHYLPEDTLENTQKESPSGDPRQAVGANGAPMGGGRERTSALRVFGRDLTELAAEKKLDPVIGRAKELERVIQILCRRTKNNPVLIGEAG
ncbi:MAG: ATP-dependent Clp protease ATP-binding subunit, partial [Victivallales bacterium]|nr:ATP-dependent Clp protease ATP-binding subunit [Victivallales bacterium]